ncbi:MAG: ribonuclease HII [Candidatus Omnitrophica bacterium]|nr:ribonuclease HII [Candidatus Omnitrophota bacterium]MBU4472809.1 ribonuclease HII [Candidatus Omnitrophota bacterium]MCG2706002.1 ribonuclease HII [Candidatus Omnitrophota bacterium]
MQGKNKRHRPGLYYENKFKKRGYNLIIGVDEAGRGPLAGPVVAAAVTLKDPHFENRIDDSKILTSQQREDAFPEIIDKSFFGIGIVDEKMIDRLNIFVATRIAMEEAVKGVINKLKHRQRQRADMHILIDGNVKINIDRSFTNIIRGDSRCRSIACASILAKVTRDRIMISYDKIYPKYGFGQHKGYPTKAHRAALKKFGPSIIHRMTFNHA